MRPLPGLLGSFLSLALAAAGTAATNAFQPAVPPRTPASPANPHPLTHPMQADAPLPAARPLPPWSSHPTAADADALIRDMREREEAATVPYSAVSITNDAATYSRAVNEITCVAAGGGNGAVEWVGTRLGAKRVDRPRKTVRVFGAADGLPAGEVVAIAADPSGANAAALVLPRPRTPNNAGAETVITAPLSLCVYTAASSRWRVLDTVAGSVQARVPFWMAPGSGYTVPAPALVMTARFVAVPRGGGREAVRLYPFGTTDAPVSVGWNKSVRADVAAVNSGEGLHPSSESFFSVSGAARVGDTLYLGTPVGVFVLDTAKPLDPAEPFHRIAPAFSVSQIVATPDGGSLYLLASDRNAPAVPPAFPPDQGQLYRVSLPAGTTSAPVPLRRVGRSGRPLSLSGILTTARDGAAWLTGPSVFSRYYDAQTGWQVYDNAGKAVDRDDNAVWQERHSQIESLQITELAPADTVPDNAAALRVCRGEYPFPNSFQRAFWGMTGTVDGNSAVVWLRHRFGRWLSPPPAAPFPVTLSSLYYPYKTALAQASSDPAVTYLIGSENRLILVATKDVPLPAGDETEQRTAQLRRNILREKVPPMPEIASYPIGGGATRLRPAVFALFGGAGDPNRLLAQTGLGVLTLDTGANRDAPAVVRIPLPASPLDPRPSYSVAWLRLFAAGNTATERYYLWRNPADPKQPKMLTFSSASPNAGFAPSPLDYEPELFAATSIGLWAWRIETRKDGNTTYSNRVGGFRFLRVDAAGQPTGDWHRVVVPDPPEPAYEKTRQYTRHEPVAFTGSVVWYPLERGNDGTERYPLPFDMHRELRGYDALRARWLAPLELNPQNDDAPIISEIGGAVYAAHAAPDGSLWRYDAAADSWQVAAPRVPRALTGVPQYGSTTEFERHIRLVAVRNHLYTFVSQHDKQVYQYDAAAKTWHVGAALPEPLAAALQSGDVFRTAPFVPLPSGDLYVGVENGLWRLSPDANAWTTVTLPAVWGTPEPGTPAASALAVPFSLSGIAATKDAVFLSGKPAEASPDALLIRWDKETRQVRFLSAAEAGIAGLRGDPPALCGDGTAAYLSFYGGYQALGNGTYRSDDVSERFVRLLTEPSDMTVYTPPGTAAKQVYLRTEGTLYRCEAGSTPEAYSAPPAGDSQQKATTTALLVSPRYVFLAVADDSGGRVYRTAPGVSPSAAVWSLLVGVPPARVESLRLKGNGGKERLYVVQADTTTELRLP